eukprot:4834029-Amphidinium_carterae.1
MEAAIKLAERDSRAYDLAEVEALLNGWKHWRASDHTVIQKRRLAVAILGGVTEERVIKVHDDVMQDKGFPRELVREMINKNDFLREYVKGDLLKQESQAHEKEALRKGKKDQQTRDQKAQKWEKMRKVRQQLDTRERNTVEFQDEEASDTDLQAMGMIYDRAGGCVRLPAHDDIAELKNVAAPTEDELPQTDADDPDETGTAHSEASTSMAYGTLTESKLRGLLKRCGLKVSGPVLVKRMITGNWEQLQDDHVYHSLLALRNEFRHADMVRKAYPDQNDCASDAHKAYWSYLQGLQGLCKLGEAKAPWQVKAVAQSVAPEEKRQQIYEFDILA